MVVNKLMYGCGALVWYQYECDDLEVRQNGMGRCLWDVGNVRNELIRGEMGWSTFEKKHMCKKIREVGKQARKMALMIKRGRKSMCE